MATELFPDGSVLNLAWNGGSFTATIFQVGGIKRSSQARDVTPLSQATGLKKKCFSKKVDHEAVPIQYFYDPALDLPPLGIAVAFVLVYPDELRQLIGNGALISDDTGELVQEEVVQGTAEFMFLGGTNPADGPTLQENV